MALAGSKGRQDLKETLLPKERKGILDQQAHRDRQANQASRAKKETRVTVDLRGRWAQPALPVGT
jgi:hypothetical protein